MPHPQKFDGNIAIPLVSPGGALNDQWSGPMAPTEWLRRCPAILQIMQELDSNFDEKTLGHSKFSRFTQEAAERGLLKMTKLENGQLEIDIPDGDGVRPGP